jgi:hypothetical protein
MLPWPARCAAIITICAVAAPLPAPAQAATTKSCAPVKNPYAGTRYEGEDLRRIRATAVSCHGARRVARGAHRKALGLPPAPSGIRRFTWRRWRVAGDTRGATDRYVARRGGRRVSWVF